MKGFKEIDFYDVKSLIPVAYDEYLFGRLQTRHGNRQIVMQ